MSMKNRLIDRIETRGYHGIRYQIAKVVRIETHTECIFLKVIVMKSGSGATHFTGKQHHEIKTCELVPSEDLTVKVTGNVRKKINFVPGDLIVVTTGFQGWGGCDPELIISIKSRQGGTSK